MAALMYLISSADLEQQLLADFRYVSLGRSEMYGTYLFAKTDIPVNAVVLKEKPYCWAITSSLLPYVCDGCLAKVQDQWAAKTRPSGEAFSLHCADCKSVYYCSEIEQGIVDEAAERRLLIRSLLALRTLIPDDVKNPLKLNCSSIPGSKSRAKARHERAETVKDLPFIQAGGFASEDVLKFAGLLETNCFSGSSPDPSDGVFKPSSVLLYPILSLVNHSCAPNLYKSGDFLECNMKALHPIKKGTQLTHPYVDIAQPTLTRRKQLEKYFGFQCDCPRCAKKMLVDHWAEQYICNSNSCDGLLVLTKKKTGRRCELCGTVYPLY